jgi:predicted MFS family arabinose efflux permease
LTDGRPSPWLVVLVATAVQGTAAMSTLGPATIAPDLAADLALSPRLIGYQVTFIYIGAVTTSMLGGALVARLGACRTSQTALCLIALGALLMTMGWLPLMALGSTVMGFGYGLTNPSASHLIMRFAAGPRMNLIFSIKQTGVPWGGMIAGLLLPTVALLAGWRAAMLLISLLALALALALQPARGAWDDDRDPARGIRQNPLAGIRLVVRTPPLRWLSVAGLMLAVSQLCLLSFLTTLLVEDLDYDLVSAGFVVSVVHVVGVVGRIGWGLVADRARDGLGVMLILVGIVTALGIVVTLLGPAWPRPLVVLLFASLGATAVGWNGVYMAEIARLAPPGQVGAATGGSLVFTFGGILVGPAGFALMAGALGSYAHAFALVVVAGMFGAVAVLLARRSER